MSDAERIEGLLKVNAQQVKLIRALDITNGKLRCRALQIKEDEDVQSVADFLATVRRRVEDATDGQVTVDHEGRVELVES